MLAKMTLYVFAACLGGPGIDDSRLRSAHDPPTQELRWWLRALRVLTKMMLYVPTLCLKKSRTDVSRPRLACSPPPQELRR